MNILKTETPNKAKSIGFDGRVVHTGSEDGRRAEEQNDLEASMAEDDENGSEKSRSSKASGDMEGLNDKAGLDPNLSRSSSIRLSNANSTNANTGNQNNSNENSGNKNDDDGPPLVDILAVFCLGMIAIPYLSSQLFFKALSVHLAFAYAAIPLGVVLVLLLIRWSMRWNCSGFCNDAELVAIMAVLCSAMIFIANYLVWWSKDVTIAFGVLLFLLTMWLLWKAYRANQGSGGNSTTPMALVPLLAVPCLGFTAFASWQASWYIGLGGAIAYGVILCSLDMRLVWNVYRANQGSGDTPMALVAISAVPCLGITIVASLQVNWYTGLGGAIAFGVILFLLTMCLVWKAYRANQGMLYSPMALVPILAVLCVDITIYISPRLYWYAGLGVAIAFGLILCSLIMCLVWNVYRANQGSSSSNNAPLVLVAISAVLCFGMLIFFFLVDDPKAFLISTFEVILFLLAMWLLKNAHQANQEDDSSSNGPAVSTINGGNTSTIQEKYPSNTYSFMAFYGPIRDTKLFCFGLFISLFQFALLFLMAANVIVPKFRTTGEVDNPGGFNIESKDREWWGGGIFPSNCSAIVRATQSASLMAYVLFPSPILKDVTESVRLFPRFRQQDPDGKLKRLRFACTLQFLQGLLSTLSVFVLVMTSTDVIEIILNFTATNFISELDDNAFEQAEKGKYGPIIEEAVHSIKGEDLPNPISKNAKHKRYKYGIAFISIVLYMATAGVMVAQDNIDIWVTPTVRVQFNDERSSYSGCYHMDTWNSTTRRYDYVGDGNNMERATIGYCLDERRWLIFEGRGIPCDAFGREEEIAHSAKTDTYDIQSSIETDWFSPFNNPIDDMYFIQLENLKESCSAFPGDGKCDEFLNNFDVQYDGGDCCATTCIGDGCGFTDDTGQKSYPNCIDPSMTPFTVRIDSDVDVPGVLKLDCISNEKNYDVLANYAVTIQANWTEPFMVEKGSNCTFYLSDDDGTITPLDYSVYHGFNNFRGVVGNEAFSIFTTTANLQRQDQTIASFEIPPILLSKDGKLTTPNPVLFTTFFETILFNETIRRKNLEHLPNLEYLEITENDLTGTIPTEFGMMTSLKSLWLTRNDLTGTIPTEFGLMKNLTVLSLSYNDITGTIPTELGLTTSLTFLSLDGNALTGTIPTELGLLTSLTELYLYWNNLSGSTPSEVLELGLYCEGCP